jgi:hypothetical protein
VALELGDRGPHLLGDIPQQGQQLVASPTILHAGEHLPQQHVVVPGERLVALLGQAVDLLRPARAVDEPLGRDEPVLPQAFQLPVGRALVDAEGLADLLSLQGALSQLLADASARPRAGHGSPARPLHV